jgi:phage baseplate assembly protein W
MENPDFLGTGIGFPFSMENGKLRMSDGADSIREAILLILRTQTGERVMRPRFGAGIERLLFAENNTSTHSLVTEAVRTALLEFEPRINLQTVQVSQDPDEAARLNIEIKYTIVTSNREENFVYPFYLESGQ